MSIIWPIFDFLASRDGWFSVFTDGGIGIRSVTSKLNPDNPAIFCGLLVNNLNLVT